MKVKSLRIHLLPFPTIHQPNDLEALLNFVKPSESRWGRRAVQGAAEVHPAPFQGPPGEHLWRRLLSSDLGELPPLDQQIKKKHRIHFPFGFPPKNLSDHGVKLIEPRHGDELLLSRKKSLGKHEVLALKHNLD